MRHFRNALLSHRLDQVRQAERDPAVRAVLDLLPGAEVVAVRQPTVCQCSKKIMKGSVFGLCAECHCNRVRLQRPDSL